MEETGWRITGARRFGAFRRFCYMPDYDRWAEKICTIYVAQPTLRLGPPTEKGHSAHWMPAHQALDLLGNDGDRALLARALGGRAK
jgi:8-oxo-dGTP diphosphatase